MTRIQKMAPFILIKRCPVFKNTITPLNLQSCTTKETKYYQNYNLRVRNTPLRAM